MTHPIEAPEVDLMGDDFENQQAVMVHLDDGTIHRILTGTVLSVKGSAHWQAAHKNGTVQSVFLLGTGDLLAQDQKGGDTAAAMGMLMTGDRVSMVWVETMTRMEQVTGELVGSTHIREEEAVTILQDDGMPKSLPVDRIVGVFRHHPEPVDPDGNVQ